MTSYPYLSLNKVTINPAIAKRLPPQLAYYYLAFPLAEDDEGLTMVMAYPAQHTTRSVLETFLGTPIVPVQSSVQEIRAALNLLWAEENPNTDFRLIVWSEADQQAASVIQTAHLVGEAISPAAICIDATRHSLETVLAIARQERYHLTVIGRTHPKEIARLIAASATPILFVFDAISTLKDILFVLRGHSPDESALNWLIPMARSQSSQVTLLSVAPPVKIGTSRTRILSGLAPLLTAENAAGEHIAACSQQLVAGHVDGKLRLRQGTPEQEIAAEVTTNTYDLIVIAAEAHGDFVQRVLNMIEEAQPHSKKNLMLVMKPIQL